MSEKELEGQTPEEGKTEGESRQKTFARRALLQAGWAVPAIVAFGLPMKSDAASVHTDLIGHGDIHIDTGTPGTPGHTDTGHNDQQPPPHIDFGPPAGP